MRVFPVNRTISKNTTNKNIYNKPLSVTKHTSFKGQYFNDIGYFTDEEIVDTYKYMKYPDDKWRKIAESDFIGECPFFKYVFGGGADDIEYHLDQIQELRTGLKERERLEQLKKEERENIANKNLALANAKESFQTNFISLIEMEKNGNATSIPNGILIEKEDEKTFNDFINWTKDSILYTSKKIEYPQNSIENAEENLQKIFLNNFNNILKESKSNYENNSIRTLLHIPDFEFLGEEIDSNKRIIATFKALLSSCAEKYKCTFLLSVPKEKLSKIDPILLVDSRIQLKLKI